MVTIEFEECDGELFAHIVSTSGVLGHAQEVRDTVPAGTWLTMPEHLHRLTPWLVKKCGFKYIARVSYEHQLLDILKKE